MKLSPIYKNERGFALPAVMMVLLFIAMTHSIMFAKSNSIMRVSHSQEMARNTFTAADAAISAQISDIVNNYEQWLAMEPIPNSSKLYTSFSPLSNRSTNGVPSDCTDNACMRSRLPIGGSLIKNISPFDKMGGGIVRAGKPIHEQLVQANSDGSAPDGEIIPEPDYVFNDVKTWTQVERLDSRYDPASAIGSSLDQSESNSQSRNSVRYRITAYAQSNVTGRESSTSVLVTTIAMPPYR